MRKNRDPIDSVGNETNIYRMIKEFNFYIKQWEKEISTTSKKADVTIGISTDIYILSQYSQSKITVFGDGVTENSDIETDSSKEIVKNKGDICG